MFDFEYNTNVGFVPRVAVIGAKYEQVEEDIEEIQGELGDLSKNVADNSAAIEENSAAIANNSVAIEENAVAISGNSVAIEKNAAAIAENAAAIEENAAAIIDEARLREAEIAAINRRIDNLPAFETKLVEKLPEEGEPDIIYLVKDEGKDTCSEFVYVDGDWEKLGSEIDLSDYVKNEALEAAIAPLAVQENVYTKAEADAKFITEHQDLSDYVKEEVLEAAIAPLAVQENVYTKSEADAKFLTEHQDLSGIESDIQNVSGSVENLENEIELVSGYIEDLSENVYTKTEADAKFLTEHQDLSDYVKNEALEAAIAPLAVQENVYTKSEADAKFITEHQDLSGIESDIESLSGAVENVQSEVETLSGSVEDLSENVSYEFESVDTKLAGLAEVNAVQNEKISAVTADYKKLKDIVGDMGGDVEYLVPSDGKLTDVLKKSGTVKLSEDTQSATYTGGITSKNVTKLHLNGKTLTFTGTTVNNPGIMTRGSEQLTVIGKGTFDANGRIAIEANGTNSVINLSGSTGFFGAEPTYVTDRSGGELIYCYLGTINIYAGIFKNEGADKKFLLNCYDANYRSGKANIVVMGGKFYDFDPANNTAEGEGTSFVPDGYESVHTTEEIDGVVHDVYTVKKSA